MDVMVVTLQEHGFTLNDMELLQEDFTMIPNLAYLILFLHVTITQLVDTVLAALLSQLLNVFNIV